MNIFRLAFKARSTRGSGQAYPSLGNTNKKIDVILSTPPRVVLHRPDGTTATAQEGDYVTLFTQDHVGIVRAKDLAENFVKVQV